MKIRRSIIDAITRTDDAARQYGEAGPTPEAYAEAILEAVSELAGVEDIENVLTERTRYKRALEYIAQAPVSSETEIVLQGRAMIGLLHKEVGDEEDH